MCLAIPVRIEEVLGAETAIADIGGVRKEINVALISDLAVGDYVIMHVGYALNKIDPQEAERTLALFAELDELDQKASIEATQ
ncbi:MULTISPECIES: HypC/HybG/HupF family hydrogenase formation chaperone [unclassified Neptuniibacter]|uniref:HypC/HybG/HupF family hydrogenase formation chaperone n=1 Tax=unclassified Neptuniibacter TaxID=2630693 RepID=UPI000C58661B|nr:MULTISPECIES: HypC/HybG/HupF family hydrogenase formation chaperone [unclassified Neptuniibacter]MAY42568.1 HypC/HybG/HupF family hydrogenase formation chaperone [Oceanospirillaceae bacterium]|tara:strand:+ start:33542 stop:33790 length:249 start_codon:yes stop_codon:yes gene_type:complete